MMNTVYNYYGKPVDFDAAMWLADKDLCEELNNDPTIENDQQYFERYADMHAAKFDGEEFAPYYGLAW